MKISNKLRKAILNEISAVMLEEQDEQCRDFIEFAPDMWMDFQKERFDHLTILNIKLEKRIDAKLLSS